MQRSLDLDDIQGNVTRAYGRYAFPFSRSFFLNIQDCGKGRQFVDAVRKKVTTGATWTETSKPRCTVNIGFTFFGLYKLLVPQRTLRDMPEEFISGMRDRAFLLGDRDPSKTEAEARGWDAHWDPVWRNNRTGDGDIGNDNVHIWVSFNAQLKELGKAEPVDELEKECQWLRDLCADLAGGVRIIPHNGRAGDQEYQEGSVLFVQRGDKLIPTPNEHFGFTDAIGDPVFRGQLSADEERDAVTGTGKWMKAAQGWQPIEPGEFVLGHPDESQELPPIARPWEFMANGTFMAYRKLHQNVASFEAVVAEEARTFARLQAIDEPEARETLRAKMCGRWSDGVPLAVAPTYAEWQAATERLGFNDEDPIKALRAKLAYIRSPEASNFRYADDMLGYKTPLGAHIRRMNTRDYMDPLNQTGLDPATGCQFANPNATHGLNKRRRILRRGLPYGPPPGAEKTDETEQGVAMISMCASLQRQFEFVQQQWIQYGLDFHQGNDTCPMLGNHDRHRRFSIQSDPKSGKPPFIMSKLRTFVECRGGDYFFVPSLTSLRMMAMGIIDPT